MKIVIYVLTAALFTFGAVGYAQATPSFGNANQDQAQGQAQGQLQGQAQGQAQGQGQLSVNSNDSKSKAQAAAVAVSEGSSATTGDSSALSNISVDVTTDYKRQSPGAPAVMPNGCQGGFSAGALKGAAGVVNEDIVCEFYKVAITELGAYNVQQEWCATDNIACDEELMSQHLLNYNNALASANAIVEGTIELGVVSKAASYLVLPGAIAWLLVFLL